MSRVKRIHTGTKIFFSDPYVLRIDYGEQPITLAMADYTKLCRRAYRLLTGTWGYTSLEYEVAQFKNDHNHPTAPGPGHFVGMAPGAVVASLLDSDWKQMPRGYICFENEMDALQFKLTLGVVSTRVYMWPSSRDFTIHEVVETDES